MPGNFRDDGTVAIAIGAAVSDPIPIEGFIVGTFQMPASFTGSNLTFKVSDRPNAQASDMQTAQNAENSDDEPAVAVSANKPYRIPTHVMEHKFLAFELDENQAADISLAVNLESPARV